MSVALLIHLYLSVGILWGLFAVYQQHMNYPTLSKWRWILVAVLSVSIWPVSVVVALVKHFSGIQRFKLLSRDKS